MISACEGISRFVHKVRDDTDKLSPESETVRRTFIKDLPDRSRSRRSAVYCRRSSVEAEGEDGVVDSFSGATVLVTGGTGSFGSTMTRRLLARDIG